MKKSTKTPEQFESAVITVQNVAEMLNISLSSAYELVLQAYEAGDKADFKVLRCGRTYRVIKQSFFDFLFGTQKGA